MTPPNRIAEVNQAMSPKCGHELCGMICDHGDWSARILRDEVRRLRLVEEVARKMAEAMVSMKSEAYGEKQWAIVVDLTGRCLSLPLVSDLLKEQNSVD